MSEVLQTNLFFFITAVAVVTLSVLLGIALYKVIKILRGIEEITNRLKEGSEAFVEDVASLRVHIVDGIMGNIVRKFTGGTPKKSRRGGKKKEVDSETGDDAADTL